MFETYGKKSRVDKVFLQFSQRLRYKREKQLCWRSFSHEIGTFVDLEEYLDLR